MAFPVAAHLYAAERYCASPASSISKRVGGDFGRRSDVVENRC